ncbi:MAG: hypothetical protein ABIK98_08415 [Pseudomonadota bacterium]|nr:hypothetical protein [Pseudomonadota bacterium]MBU1299054.1 hypothetical protein [Bacteroidota bacterium]MBU1422342.1 hypothetical protein [Bacteroidota bacterium]
MEKQLIVDDRPESYGPFFVDDFAHKAFDASDDISVLREPVFDLIADWRSASYAGALPYLIPSSIKGFHDAFVNKAPSTAGILKYSSVVLAKLSQQIPQVTSDPALQRALGEKIVALANEICAAAASVTHELDENSIWQQFLSLHPFYLGLHGTMRLVYLSVYGAYENFIVRILSIAHGGARIRVTDRDFKKRFRGAFGDLIEDAWLSPEINAFKLVRHAIMHAGGRITPDLRSVRIPVVVHDDALHIFPEHIRQLYDTLKEPALRLMQAKCFRKERIEPLS